MICCDAAKNQRLYLAQTTTGQACYCKKCGRAWPATKQDIDRVSAIDQQDTRQTKRAHHG